MTTVTSVPIDPAGSMSNKYQTFVFEKKDALIAFLQTLPTLDNVVVSFFDTQVFGWPAGHSTSFTAEKGRSIAFVAKAIEDVPHKWRAAFGHWRKIFSSQEELLEMLIAQHHSNFMEVWIYEKLVLYQNYRKGSKYADVAAYATFVEGRWVSPEIPATADEALSLAQQYGKHMILT